MLPQWFVQGRNVVRTKVSYFKKFPAYMQNIGSSNYRELLSELNQKKKSYKGDHYTHHQ